MKELFGMRISLQTGVLALILAAGSAVASTGADVVLRGGNIYTVDAARSWAQTVVIKGN